MTWDHPDVQPGRLLTRCADGVWREVMIDDSMEDLEYRVCPRCEGGFVSRTRAFLCPVCLRLDSAAPGR